MAKIHLEIHEILPFKTDCSEMIDRADVKRCSKKEKGNATIESYSYYFKVLAVDLEEVFIPKLYCESCTLERHV